MKLSQIIGRLNEALNELGDREVDELMVFGEPKAITEVNYWNGDRIGRPGRVIVSILHLVPDKTDEELAKRFDDDERDAKERERRVQEQIAFFQEAGPPYPFGEETITPQEQAWYEDYHGGYKQREAERRLEEERESLSSDEEDELPF